MPTYPVINQKTGETKEMNMSIKSYDEWKEANPDWDKDWSKGCAGVGEVGEWKDKLTKKYPGWNQVLDKVGKSPKANVGRIR
jgi:hypothetical protein|tara:strand:- start:3331 stop:3576 length:246 start_codon:yes stop_codon:yes gene_type:complete